jgi:hypothetical protein
MKQSIKLVSFFVSILLFIGLSVRSIGANEHTFLPVSSIKKDTTYAKDGFTGLTMAPNYELVLAHCTGCHSSKLILQYGATRETWLEKIRWMQKYHKLWDLGESEPLILDYLATFYPEKIQVDRRKPLENIEWYKLETSTNP